MIHQTTDTSPEAESVQFDLIKKLSAQERARKAIRWSNVLARQCKDAIVRNQPGLSRVDVDRRFIELNYRQLLPESVFLQRCEEEHMDDRDDLVCAILGAVSVLSSMGVRFFVGGSVAGSFHGAMRSTMDVDLIAELTGDSVESFLDAVAQDYDVSKEAARSAIQSRSSFNLIHLPTSFNVDIFVSRGRPSDEMAFNRATAEPRSHRLEIPRKHGRNLASR